MKTTWCLDERMELPQTDIPMFFSEHANYNLSCSALKPLSCITVFHI